MVQDMKKLVGGVSGKLIVDGGEQAGGNSRNALPIRAPGKGTRPTGKIENGSGRSRKFAVAPDRSRFCSLHPDLAGVIGSLKIGDRDLPGVSGTKSNCNFRPKMEL